MLKLILITLLPLLVFFTNGSDGLVASFKKPSPKAETGTLEKMIVANGTVGMNIDVSRLGAKSRAAESRSLQFAAEPDSFFKILVFNGELRGPLPGSMPLSPQGETALPGKLGESYRQLALEHNAWGSRFELAIRDAKSGFTFFDVEGHYYDYDPNTHLFSVIGGRILISEELARELGRGSEAGTVVGSLDVSTTMRAIEVSEIANGTVTSESLPPSANPETGTVPGPDVIVGDLTAMIQPSGSASATQVGLAIGTDSCNFGTVNLNWFQNPNNDHPVIPQNLYRMSGGPNNDERFEQIGQSQVKHAFTALTENICNLGCNGTGGSQLGSGCSDPYSAGLNSGPNLGSKAWINPFTGAYPRNDVTDPNLRNNNHGGHTHPSSGSPLHRVITNISDLSTTQNPGATYYGEAQYVTPHEYTWCQANPGQCNMYNNVSYRRFNVNGTGSPFSFSPAAATVRMKAAIEAWPGATFVQVIPAAGTDGVAIIAYKVTNPSAGVWRYEYAIYNQNLDRGIQSFSVPVGAGAILSSIGFHAPPQHPGFSADGTVNNAGFSSEPWTQTQGAGAMTWNTETFAQNQNANAIRWGTTYNFRFESNRPPQAANATIGFFKTGSPITAAIVGPSGSVASNVSVGGRVLNGTRGVNAARVTITDSNNVSRTVVTNSFGYYRFDNVQTGSTYTMSASAKRFTFTPQSVPVNDNLTGIDFTANP